MSVSDIRGPEQWRVCSKTGLALVPAAAHTVYRLAKKTYGPLNPLYRDPSAIVTRDAWNRYDVAGQRTVYVADTEEGAYGELLAPLKPTLPARASIYFDDVAARDELESLIRQEWAATGHRAPRDIDLGWLSSYRLYRIRLPAAGWFIDIEASSSLSAIAHYAPPDLAERGITEISVAELRGSDRRLTTAIADRLWPLTLDDDSLAHGIMYGSRHGSDWNCWAIWLRRTEPAQRQLITTADAGTKVSPPAVNPPLARILSTYGLTATR